MSPPVHAVRLPGTDESRTSGRLRLAVDALAAIRWLRSSVLTAITDSFGGSATLECRAALEPHGHRPQGRDEKAALGWAFERNDLSFAIFSVVPLLLRGRE